VAAIRVFLARSAGVNCDHAWTFVGSDRRCHLGGWGYVDAAGSRQSARHGAASRVGAMAWSSARGWRIATYRRRLDFMGRLSQLDYLLDSQEQSSRSRRSRIRAASEGMPGAAHPTLPGSGGGARSRASRLRRQARIQARSREPLKPVVDFRGRGSVAMNPRDARPGASADAGSQRAAEVGARLQSESRARRPLPEETSLVARFAKRPPRSRISSFLPEEKEAYRGSDAAERRPKRNANNSHRAMARRHLEGADRKGNG